MTKGKLIVIEGIDGSGKTTQLELLKDYLIANKNVVKTISFPRYQDSFYGKFIGRFLQGEFGSLDEINPYLISLVYAEDRQGAKREIKQWLNDRSIILSGRYVSSNLAHQSGRLPLGKREEYIQWNMELEYKVNNMPRENLVIYLHLPYLIALQLMAKKKKDMVEEDVEYLKRAQEAYLALAEKFSHWVKVDCSTQKGEVRSIAEIHSDIKSILAQKGIVR